MTKLRDAGYVADFNWHDIPAEGADLSTHIRITRLGEECLALGALHANGDGGRRPTGRERPSAGTQPSSRRSRATSSSERPSRVREPRPLPIASPTCASLRVGVVAVSDTHRAG